jgi:hypothetical protein
LIARAIFEVVDRSRVAVLPFWSETTVCLARVSVSRGDLDTHIVISIQWDTFERNCQFGGDAVIPKPKKPQKSRVPRLNKTAFLDRQLFQ